MPKIPRYLLTALLALAVTGGDPGAASPQFTEVTQAAGLERFQWALGFAHADYTGGGAVGDFNRDGLQDLFVVIGGTGIPDALYINQGDGTFLDRAAAWGVNRVHRGKGAAVADFNNDGWLDLFVSSAGPVNRVGPGHHLLYRNNGNGTFTDVALAAGVNFTTGPQQQEDGFGAAFGDYDLDGDLDLFVAGFAANNTGNRLFRNNGDETFTDVTDAIGLFSGTPVSMKSFTPRLIDMDGDRYPELLLVSDFGTSRYFRNNGDGTFTDITAASGTSLEENGMGGTVGDFNNDGLPDWYVTSIYLPSASWTGNKLYHNQGGHVYTEHATALGVFDGGYGWGALAVDFNHDRLLDIAETNGWSQTTGEFGGEPTYLWIQQNGGSYVEQSAAAGLVHLGLGRGMANFDYDEDGDQDVVIFGFYEDVRLYRNDVSGNDAHWIRVFLDTTGVAGLPADGYGAKISATAGGQTQTRWLNGGDNFLSHSELSAHFGLKNSQSVSELRVDWPDGSVTILNSVTADRTLTLRAGPREQVCNDAGDDDNDGLTDCDDPDCCGQTGCTGGQGVCCSSSSQCDDALSCNGAEQCIDDLCVPGDDPCPDGCIEPGATCVECNVAADCDDGTFCNGVESCAGNLCQAGAPPCAGVCDEVFDTCAECAVPADCADDGLFCNGTETCMNGVCESARETCPNRPCDETADLCLATIDLQPRAGEPLVGLTVSQLARFEAGREAFEAVTAEPGGLGPAYNATSCAGCHAIPAAGAAAATATYFGMDDLQGAVTPLPGGPLLQTQAISGNCAETLPVGADVVSVRSTGPMLGLGLIEAVPDDTLHGRVTGPPAGISGRAHYVTIAGEPGEIALGKFGHKGGQATVRATVAREAVEQIGLTGDEAPQDEAPNGDALQLAQCDSVADPEAQPDLQGLTLVDRITDYLRYLAPAPQTPRSGMTGASQFDAIGCNDCHTPGYFTSFDPRLEPAIGFRVVLPYSDFLLHDMGTAGETMQDREAVPGEVRTTPLWGVRDRDPLWHDGRFSGATAASRLLAAIAEHDAAGSEAQASAQAFAALPAVDRDAILAFLDSLGRAEFDHDGDGDVDLDDFVVADACFSGPGSFYTADDPCSISDIDLDGDVDDDDMALFDFAADGPAGEVPDGATIAGPQLVVERLGGGQLGLAWGASCSAGDRDYAIYEGTLGTFDSHVDLSCSSGGLTQTSVSPGAGDTYYLVVPTTGFREGDYGRSSAGVQRPAGISTCLPRASGACQP